jgi:hypothetical protein
VLDPSILKTERPPVTRVRSNDYCARRNAPDLAAAPPARAGSFTDPDCVKTFFRPKHCTQPGTIRVDTTV